MNLSPSWIASLESGGHSAVHWSSIGSPSALDTEIMAWARENRYIVFTNDLDYGALLFATAATSPSVIQIRAEMSCRQVLGMLSCSRSKPPQGIYRRELLSQLIPAGCGFRRYHSEKVPLNLRKACLAMTG